MLERLRINRFLVLGRAGMDLYADPPGRQAEEAAQFTSALGGSAANIAAGVTRLGGQVSLLTTLSDDAVGRYVHRQLRLYGIDTTHVSFLGGQCRTSLAVVETRSENCQSVIYRNGAADFLLTAAQVVGIEFTRYGALIVTGTALAAEPSRSATMLAISHAREAGVPVILDVDYRPYSWADGADATITCRKAAEASDVVIGNDVEWDVLAGGTGGRAFAEAFAAECEIVIYKMGERGSRTFAGHMSFETPVCDVTALKPTGAGDAFMAGFVTGLANGANLEDAVRRGTAAAAIVVTRVGCAPASPSRGELEQFLHETTAQA